MKHDEKDKDRENPQPPPKPAPGDPAPLDPQDDPTNPGDPIGPGKGGGG